VTEEQKLTQAQRTDDVLAIAAEIGVDPNEVVSGAEPVTWLLLRGLAEALERITKLERGNYGQDRC
jgi:hypothetical protein